MKKVIAIVGMPGAGKTKAASFFKEKGFEVLRFGSVIDDKLKEENLQWSPKNNTYYRKKIRKELGMAAVAIKMMPRIEEALKKTDKLILDGLYSWEEYLYLKEKFQDLILFCVYARPNIRYSRLTQRKERTFTKDEARERDINEIEITNKGGPIAIADYLVKNETSKDDFYKELEEFLRIISDDSL